MDATSRRTGGVKGTPGISGNLHGTAGRKPRAGSETVGVGDHLGPGAVAVVLLRDRGQGLSPAHGMVDHIHLRRLGAQRRLGGGTGGVEGQGGEKAAARFPVDPASEGGAALLQALGDASLDLCLQAGPGFLSLPIIGSMVSAILYSSSARRRSPAAARRSAASLCDAASRDRSEGGAGGGGGGGAGSTRGGGDGGGGGGGARGACAEDDGERDDGQRARGLPRCHFSFSSWRTFRLRANSSMLISP